MGLASMRQTFHLSVSMLWCRKSVGETLGAAVNIRWKTIAPLVIWLAIYLTPVPAGLNANQWHYFAVFAAVIAGLILESMPVGAVGLIGLTFAGVMGYVESDPNKSLRWMLSGFSEARCG
jgi:di/tricarboxylate transporter